MSARRQMLRQRSLPVYGAGGAGLGLDLEYDPADIGTLFQNTAGTTPVTAVGQGCALIVNKGVATGLNATQGTSGARPLYESAGGLSWLLSDGIDDRMSTTSAISQFLTTTACDIFVAARFVSIGTDAANAYDNDCLFTDGDGVSGGAHVGLHAKATGPALQAFNYDGDYDVAAVTGDGFAAGDDFVARLQHVDGNMILTVNNGTPATVASGNTGGTLRALRLFTTYNNALFAAARLYWMGARKTAFSPGEAAMLWARGGDRAGIIL